MKFLRIKGVVDRVGWSVPQIWKMSREGRFPPPVKLGPNTTAWVADEVEDWMRARVEERDAAA